MSFKLSFTEHGQAIKAALKKIHNAPSSDNTQHWLLCSVISDCIVKLECTGDGIEELSECFEDSKEQFAIARVFSKGINVWRILLFCWCGDGVPPFRKGLFNSHVVDAKLFLSPYHMEIMARNEGDVSPSDVLGRVNNSDKILPSPSKTAPKPTYESIDTGSNPSRKLSFQKGPANSTGISSASASAAKNSAQTQASFGSSSHAESSLSENNVTSSVLNKSSMKENNGLNSSSSSTQSFQEFFDVSDKAIPIASLKDRIAALHSSSGSLKNATSQDDSVSQSSGSPNYSFRKTVANLQTKPSASLSKSVNNSTSNSKKTSLTSIQLKSDYPDANQNTNDRMEDVTENGVAKTTLQSFSPGNLPQTEVTDSTCEIKDRASLSERKLSLANATIYSVKKDQTHNHEENATVGIMSIRERMAALNKAVAHEDNTSNNNSQKPIKTPSTVPSDKNGDFKTSINKESASILIHETSTTVSSINEEVHTTLPAETSASLVIENLTETAKPEEEIPLTKPQEQLREQIQQEPQSRPPTPPLRNSSRRPPSKANSFTSPTNSVSTEPLVLQPLHLTSPWSVTEDDPQNVTQQTENQLHVSLATSSAMAEQDLNETADALYEVIEQFEASDDNGLSLLPGHYVKVVSVVDDNWWIVQELQSGMSGIFPAVYLSLLSNPSGIEKNDSTANQAEEPVYVALYDYSASNEGDLTIVAGDRIYLAEEVTADWWCGTLCHTNERGVFPSSYVAPE